KVLRDGENVTRGVPGATEDGNSSLDRVWRVIEGNVVVGGTRVEGVVRQLSGEEVLREGVVEQSPAGAEHGFTLSEDVVGEAETRAEVVPVLGIQAARTARLSNVLQVSGGRKNAEQIVLLADHAVIIPAQTVVKGELRSEAPVVLEVEGVVVLEGVAV